MRTSIALLLLAALACDDEPMPDEPMQCKEIQKEVRAVLTAHLDLVVLVGNASSMAEEQAALSDQLGWFLDQMESLWGGLPDLHAAVMSDDGAEFLVPAGCPALTDDRDFVVDRLIDQETGTREWNYTGDIGNQLSCMMQVGTAGDEGQRPLASLARALEDEERGFRRPAAALAIAILTDGEDASPDEVAAYAERVQATAKPPASALVSVVSGGAAGCTLDGFTEAAPAPRLAGFLDAFGEQGAAVSMCSEESLWAGLAGMLDLLPVGMCIGDQVASPPDCRVSDMLYLDQDNQEEYPLPSCDDSVPPCFAIVVDEPGCPETISHLRLLVDRGGTHPREGSVTMASCVVESTCQ